MHAPTRVISVDPPARLATASTPTVSVAQMQAIDQAAMERYGIPRLLLMEHAGLAIARVARAMMPQPQRPMLVCCGTGFNGGDGLAAARHLQAWGYAVAAVLLGPRQGLREEPLTYARLVEQLGVPLTGCESVAAVDALERHVSPCGLIIDALLGVGMQGAVRDPMASLIRRLNASRIPILAADIPSGLDADTGDVRGVAVRAAATVTFGLPKQGCRLNEGPAHTGTLIVDPITMPRALLEGASA